MSRSTQWRRVVSDACNWHQTQALEATLYLLRQTGPTGFLLKEEGETRTVKVYLGDPHTCTCPVFKKERDLCKHICWLLLRKFRLSPNDPLSWQLGLVEREVNEILKGRNTAQQPQSTRRDANRPSGGNVEETVDGRPLVKQREIAENDVCPICQDELLSKKLPVTYCRFGCGNTIHMKCMNVWAEHQQKSSSDKSIKCPMCREDFGTLEALKTEARNAGAQKPAPHGVRLDRHLGIACSHCSKAPIEGKCYKCSVCPHFYLCQRCFNLPVHTDHCFQFRQKRNQRWRSATRTLGASLPPALVQDFQNRDLSEEDYDSLLLLDRNTEGDLSTLSEECLQRLPIERVRDRSVLLHPGAQCRVCLRGYLVGQHLRRLPCQHKSQHITSQLTGKNTHNIALQLEGNVVDYFFCGHLARYTAGSDFTPSTRNGSQSAGHPNTHGQVETDTQTANGLAINAMGIPVASNRLNQTAEGSNPSLRRPPRIPLQPLPTTPQGLEVSGTAVAAGDENEYDEQNNNRLGLHYENRDDGVPGERLLRQARLHRQRIAHHLSGMNHRDNSSDRNQRTVTLGDLIQCQSGVASGRSDVTPLDVEDRLHGPESISRHNSAGSIISVGSDTTGSSNDVGRRHSRRHIRTHSIGSSLRERASSLERPIPTIQSATQNVRDLYLGNDPSRQPPVYGQMTQAAVGQPQQRRVRPTRLFQHTASAKQHCRIPRHNNSNNNMSANGVIRTQEDFRLDGFAVDN